MPYWQKLGPELSLVSRTTLAADEVAAPMRDAIWQVDRDMSIAALRPMEDLVRVAAQDRFQTGLVLLFGVAAALLASLGIFGVVSYSVAQRTNELPVSGSPWARHRSEQPRCSGRASCPFSPRCHAGAAAVCGGRSTGTGPPLRYLPR